MFKFFKKNNFPSVVKFTGGMGAQMISAAIYYQMQLDNKEVYADLSYFDQPKELAVDGMKGKASHWDWQLQPFGLSPAMFSNIKDTNLKKYTVIEDGMNKLNLALNAFKNEAIQKIFPTTPDVAAHLIDQNDADYLCIHVRRGDYLNVPTHLTSDRDFYSLAQRLKNIAKHVVVVSDSTITVEFQSKMKKLFSKTTFLDRINEYESHCVMRHASILVGSNSQFSLVAAILNKDALIFLPRVWFGKDHPELETVVSNLGNFQVLS